MLKNLQKIPLKMITLFILFGILLMVFVSHDDFLYHQPIIRVDSAKVVNTTKNSDSFQNTDYSYQQKIYGTIVNGKYNGEKISLNNTYTKSGAMDHKYSVGQHAFVILHKNCSLNATIKDYKRDVPIVFLLYLVIALLCIFLKFAGLTAVGSIIVNTILFMLAIYLDGFNNGNNVLLIFSLLSIVFSAVTLWMVIGINKQMLVTLVSTVLCTTLSIIVSLIVFKFTHEKGIFYESMQYVTQPPRPLFLASTIIGSLGAVMDESTDIISSLFALKMERPQISKKQLFLSGRNIGKSIMGPLINVLFFIFMGETLAMTLLFLKNGNSWGYSFSMNMSLGMVQSLISGIGIVLAIPVASALTSLIAEEAKK
ncbi:YibE/F family protein [Apilactobacillus apisilvae]|uniref:YibE/F family protein n=1 Tax=Apilactobacillus apisilvae TaxID=2923364 RepID=A0ABY4PFY5_9LACO|nr:YibE/F family protein [Apilactobacillus apisilvae]UQS84448.1 YibE/F family protein [Apilactobacillus apisilvae]